MVAEVSGKNDEALVAAKQAVSMAKAPLRLLAPSVRWLQCLQ